MTQLDGKTLDIKEENIEKMKQFFPEAFEEGKIDFDKLRQLLGDYVDDSTERYNFTWNGKGQALRLSQTPSMGTLRPCKEESKDWDTTQNLYIEGDNLEVLKLLQKSYHNKIKMIYIDPPYNTGSDFVYSDDFKDEIRNYKKITGQIDINEKNIGTNTESNGRFHTAWLNMMYPRLRLAKNLLSKDGIIFISIANQELSNLLQISNSIFGEKNLVNIIAWESKTKCQNTRTAKRQLQSKQEYILVYKNNEERYEFNLIIDSPREYPDIDENGKCRIEPIGEMSASGIRGRETMVFPIKNVMPKEGNQWKYGKETIEVLDSRNDIFVKNGKVYMKVRPCDEDNKFQPFWSFISKDIGTAENAKAELRNIIGEHDFETIKPANLIKKLIFHVTDKDDYILDFFSGTATTAQATIQLNSEDGGHRKFITVQLPEISSNDSLIYQKGYKNICEIGKERIRRVGERIKAECQQADLDIGFKDFKLDTSNIKKWQADGDTLEADLGFAVDNVVKGRSELDVVYEIILKMGLSLTYPVVERDMKGKKIYVIGDGALMICLDLNITLDVAEGMVALQKEYQPEVWKVVFYDNGFVDDQTKTNSKEILKNAGLDEDAFTTI